MSIDLEELEDQLVKSMEKAVTSLPKKTLDAIKKAKTNETKGARSQINSMLDAVNIGEEQGIPICQDTGVPTFYVRIGSDFPGISSIGEIEPVIRTAVKRATDEIPLRPNAINPITEKNSGNNTGKHIPYIDWKIVEGKKIKIDFLPKGGGSENMSQLSMMNPTKGLEGVKEIVLERIGTMKGKPCPPTVIGIGLGGGANIAMNLAKKSLLRPIGEHHKEKQVAKLEKELKQKANQLKVGPMGIGGETTVLDIKIDYAHRHPASYPIGIVIQCWCNRRTQINIKPDGTVEMKQ